MAKKNRQKKDGWADGRLGSLGLLRAPYPRHYEKLAFSRDGILIRMRPIKPEDASLLVEFFETLSSATIYFRFLRLLRELPAEWVKHFTDIEYDKDVAIIAVRQTDSGEKIIGVCRVMRTSLTSTGGEIAVVVGDDRQGKGLGTMLLDYCISIARELGMRKLWGLISSDNEKVLSMAKKLGFSIRSSSEDDSVEVEMSLD